MFNEDEDTVVCRLPDRITRLPDRITTYHAEMKKRRRASGEASEEVEEVWRKLWSLNIPGVVKVFV